MDTGATALFKEKVKEAAERLRPFKNLILLNSHSHPDHTANNSVINEIDAENKSHYLSKKGISSLDYGTSIIKSYKETNRYFNFLDGAKPPFPALMKIFKLLAKINPEIPYSLITNSLKNFRPLEPSINTVQPYEEKKIDRLPIKSEEWNGWDFNNDVYVMESGGHSPDSMVFYLPKIKLIFAADETYYFFPIWPDSDTSKQKKVIEKIIRMNDSGEAELFVDGHHHNVVAGNGIKVMLTELLEYHKVFQDELLAIIKNSPKSLTVHEIYKKMKKLRHIPGVEEHFRLEFPIMPNYLKTIIAVSLTNAGCATEGPYGKKRFYIG
jgi:glyoxylase-like metal-dependent hydrolase (beta-lactamase superfamily II)